MVPNSPSSLLLRVFHFITNSAFVMNLLPFNHLPPSVLASVSSHPPSRSILLARYVFPNGTEMRSRSPVRMVLLLTGGWYDFWHDFKYER